MKFVQVVDGFAVRIDSIVSIKQDENSTLIIETENRSYTVMGDFNMFLEFIEDDNKESIEKLTEQFFAV